MFIVLLMFIVVFFYLFFFFARPLASLNFPSSSAQKRRFSFHCAGGRSRAQLQFVVLAFAGVAARGFDSGRSGAPLLAISEPTPARDVATLCSDAERCAVRSTYVCLYSDRSLQHEWHRNLGAIPRYVRTFNGRVRK